MFPHRRSPLPPSECIHSVLAGGCYGMLTHRLYLAVCQSHTSHQGPQDASRHCTYLALRQPRAPGATSVALYSARSRTRTWGASILSSALLCLLGMGSVALAAQPGSPPDSSPSMTHSPSAGFTRDSMDALDHPEAAPAPTKPHPSLSPSAPPANSTRASTAADQVKRGHRRTVRSNSEVTKPAASAKRPRPRNPIARFIYWWNGWVITAFHTKFGTVLYGSIGADTSQLPSSGAGG